MQIPVGPIQDLFLDLVSKSEPKIHKIQRLNLDLVSTAALTFGCLNPEV